jgi:dTDP-4-dehydrorhamnose 3,5-epimerase-like enzyme
LCDDQIKLYAIIKKKVNYLCSNQKLKIKMTTEQTFIKDLASTPKIFNDERGFYNQAKFHENGIKYEFIQDNQSF